MRLDSLFKKITLLPLVATALLVHTGCRDRTIIINQAPPELPEPSDQTSRDEAESMILEAFRRGRRQGFRTIRQAQGVEDPSELDEYGDWQDRRQEVRREVLADILAGEHEDRFESLLASWRRNHPDEEFACSASGAVGEDADEDAEGDAEVEPSIRNLDCWARLCPAIADLIEGGPGADGPDRRRRHPIGRERVDGDETDGWMGDRGERGVDLEELGIELPEGETIEPSALVPLMQEAYQEGFRRGVEYAQQNQAERDREREDRIAEREEALRRRLEDRLGERVAEAAEECCEGAEEPVAPCEQEGSEGQCGPDDGIEVEADQLTLVPVEGDEG